MNKLEVEVGVNVDVELEVEVRVDIDGFRVPRFASDSQSAGSSPNLGRRAEKPRSATRTCGLLRFPLGFQYGFLYGLLRFPVWLPIRFPCGLLQFPLWLPMSRC